MAFRNIHVVLSASKGGLTPVLAAAGRDVDTFAKQAQAAGASAASAGDLMAKAGKAGALLLAAALAYSVSKAVEFDREMHNVASISGEVRDNLGATERQVLNMSRRLPQSAADLARGLYDVASSGFQGAQGVQVLQAAAEAASAGMTTTAVAAKGIAAVLNAYGRSAADAGDVSDVLFQTVNLGVITFEELSSQLGDVVGTAAAAQVPIEAVGSAIAAMTLSGINAAESTTSLNRTIQAIIDPSDSMKTALQGLGYESGAQALKVDGLQKVMEKLRVATGGNLESVMALFPEIRAARGALALMANEGENYRRVTAQISDAEARSGATKRALAEQMKSVSSQLRILRNQADAAAIVLGTTLFPAITALVRGAEQLGRAAWPYLVRGFNAALPLLRNLAQVGANLATIIRNTAREVAPLAAGLAAIAGGAVLQTLNAVAAALAAITGLMARHQEVVTAVAVAYGVHLLAGLLATARAFAAVQIEKAAAALGEVANAAINAGAALTLASAAAGALAIGAVIALAAAVRGLQNAKQSANELAKETAKPFDLTNFTGLSQAINATTKEYDAAGRRASDGGLVDKLLGKGAKEIFQNLSPWNKNTITEAEEATKALARSNKEMLKLRDNAQLNERDLMQRTGFTQNQIEALAHSIGVDLTGAYDKSAEARLKVADEMERLTRTTGLTAAQLTKQTAGNIETAQKWAEAIEDIRAKVDQAFRKATDITAGFDPTTEADQVADLQQATEHLTDTQDRLSAAREAAKKKGATPAELRAVTRAEREVAQAQAEVTKAQQNRLSAGDQLARHLRQQIEDARAFSSDIQQAIARGLDPAVVRRLLEQGPKEAAPFLRAILSDNKTNLIELANQTEAALREVSASTIRIAQLTQHAISLGTATAARDLQAAIQIASIEMAKFDTVTSAEIAKTLKMPSEEIRRIAEEFGIIIGDAISKGVESRYVPGVGQVDVAPEGAGDPGGKRWGGLRMARGGVVAHITQRPRILYGEPGTGGEAFIPLGASNRIRSLGIWAEAGRRMGVATHATGSLRPALGPSGRPGGGGHTIIQVPVPERMVHQTNIGEIKAQDLDAALRQARQRERLSSLVGGSN